MVQVVEGAARGMREAAADTTGDPVPSADPVSVHRADADGDSAVVGIVAGRGARAAETLVVTADRGLAERVTALGAAVRGPGWLLDRLGDAG